MHHSNVDKAYLRSVLSYARTDKYILFLGICGTGMSALARLLCRRGYRVVGYDAVLGGEYTYLARDGIFVSDRKEDFDLSACALIVYTLAMDAEHPLLQNAIPRCSRAELLGVLMCDYPVRIAIAGSHGKSTVTALVHRILTAAGKEPTTLSGASLGTGEGTLHVGGREIFLYECCEYRDSFLYTCPTLAVLLNLELDHTDYFKDIEALESSFFRFAQSADAVLYCASDERLCRICSALSSEVASYGLRDAGNADMLASAGHTHFDGLLHEPSEDGTYPFTFSSATDSAYVRTSLLGRVGAQNALAAMAASALVGVSPSESARALIGVSPLPRRLCPLGTLGKARVYYDFAHHPTEISATVATLTQLHGAPPTVVFAPHTYSRTRDLWDGFVGALCAAREVILCPIYPARERPIEGVSSDGLAYAIGAHASVIASVEATVTHLSTLTGAIVLMGAGDLGKIKEEIEAHDAFQPIKENV